MYILGVIYHWASRLHPCNQYSQTYYKSAKNKTPRYANKMPFFPNPKAEPFKASHPAQA